MPSRYLMAREGNGFIRGFVRTTDMEAARLMLHAAVDEWFDEHVVATWETATDQSWRFLPPLELRPD